NIPVGIDLKLEQHINNQHFQKSNQLKDLLRSTLKIGNWDEARNTLLLQLEDVKKHPDLIEPAILFFTRSIHKLDYFAFDREIAQILYKLLENLSQDETQKARCRLAMKQSGIL
ncbi:hypothetical protein KBD33_05115, partial [Candidatus Gracilibacteria bacterium]|nr:hypothetical protein [Candidatus Gracilibacteria bacterium]